MSGIGKSNLETSAAKQDEASSKLWNTVVGDLQYLLRQPVVERLESRSQLIVKVSALLRQTGDILHHNRPWSYCLSQASHLQNECVARILLVLALRRQAGKALARWATCQKINPIRFCEIL